MSLSGDPRLLEVAKSKGMKAAESALGLHPSRESSRNKCPTLLRFPLLSPHLILLLESPPPMSGDSSQRAEESEQHQWGGKEFLWHYKVWNEAPTVTVLTMGL